MLMNACFVNVIITLLGCHVSYSPVSIASGRNPTFGEGFYKGVGRESRAQSLQNGESTLRVSTCIPKAWVCMHHED